MPLGKLGGQVKQSPRISKHIQTYLIGSFSFQYFTEQQKRRYSCDTSAGGRVGHHLQQRWEWSLRWWMPGCSGHRYLHACRTFVLGQQFAGRRIFAETRFLPNAKVETPSCCKAKVAPEAILGTFCMVSLMIAVCFLHRPGQADCSNYDSLPNIGFKIGNKAEDFCPRCSILIYFAFSRS